MLINGPKIKVIANFKAYYLRTFKELIEVVDSQDSFVAKDYKNKFNII